jgi:branched-chain amino acid transport system substrate-binding protein
MKYAPLRLLALAAAISVVFPAASDTFAQSKGTIKIASQSPLSGGQAALGEGIKLGAQLAVEKGKANLEKMGYKVEFVPFDDQAKPAVGVANAKNIIADKDIMAVIGHLNSGVAIPSSEVYKEVNVVMVSPANTNPVITDRGYPNVNRVCGRDDVQGVVGSEFAHALKIKSVYIVHDKTQYGQSVAEFFKADAEKKGITVLGFEGTEEKSNFDPIITPIKAKNPDLIYFGGIYDQAAPFFKQAREKGVKSKFMGPDGMDSSSLARIGGKAIVGMHYTSAAGPASALPEAMVFVDEFKKRFGKYPEPYAAEAYDAATIALRAIEETAKRGNVSREDVSSAVRKTRLSGITGEIAFDAKGDRQEAQYFVLQVVSDDPSKWGDTKIVLRTLAGFPRPGIATRPSDTPAVAQAAKTPGEGGRPSASPEVAAAKSPSMPSPGSSISFGRYHALVIGNQAYRSLPRLKTPAADATAVAELLRVDYRFDAVHLILDGTRTEMVRAFDDLRRRLGETDNLVIYYAGHGWLDIDSDRGYWLPIDAERDGRANWLSNADITDTLRALKAKHVVIVADSCYSGTLVRGLGIGALEPADMTRLAQKRARTALTSGGQEPVTDVGGAGHSVFARAFIETLRENTSVADLTTLFTVVRRRVLLNAEQTPQYSDIRQAGHDGGDFLFVRPR